jgi:hypothetical protein
MHNGGCIALSLGRSSYLLDDKHFSSMGDDVLFAGDLRRSSFGTTIIVVRWGGDERTRP